MKGLLDDALDPSHGVLVGAPCALSGSHVCESLEALCKTLEGSLIPKTHTTEESESWLAPWKKPDIPVTSSAFVRKLFDAHRRKPDGEPFLSLRIRCDSHRDVFEMMRDRYRLPSDLEALAMATSGCGIDKESTSGGAGFWRLTPAVGRAYHLWITDQVDERLSLGKSTVAALRFLADLFRRTGDWELTFAAYHAGVLGVVARVARLQETGIAKPTLWDLVENDMLSRETAIYVQTIEVYALLLENVRREPLAWSVDSFPTGDLEVPPGTWLEDIARASSMSVKALRAHNPDILPATDRIPSDFTGRFVVQVPRSVVFQARDQLQRILSARDR